jgi:hypothetical protein
LEKNTTKTAPAVAKIQFTDVLTHEVYTDLITLYEVNLNKILKENGLPELLYALAAFLTIKTHEDLCAFVNKYNDDYSKRLVVEYMSAILYEDVLAKLDGGKFATKEYQDYLVREREEGMDITITVLGMLKKNKDVQEIHAATKLPTEKILYFKEMLGI